MDRVNQLRAGGEEGRSGDATLDASSPPSEAYMSANDSSSKYFSLSDSTFDISPIKDVSLASAAATTEADHSLTDPDELLSNLSPITKKDVMLDSFKIGKEIEAANILSGGVDIFDDNDNSFDGDELVIDDNVDMDDKTNLEDKSALEEAVSESTLVETHVDVASKDTEVVLQIDGKNVDAIDIGNGLYLYRKAGQEELAAVQIIIEDKDQEPSFKFLKVRENVEGNLEVYEEFEIEVSKDVPVTKPSARKTPNVPIKNSNKLKSESSANIIVEKKDKTPLKEVSTSKVEVASDVTELEFKTEFNLNGKMMKFNESRKSPVVGTFTPMTYSSTPNKEGKPLTKTMVDQQLHPSRHSDNVKKTIEVHTDSQTKKLTDEINKQKPENQMNKNVSDDITTKKVSTDNKTMEENIQHTENQERKNLRKDNVSSSTSSDAKITVNKERQTDATASTENQIKMNLDNKIPSNSVDSTNVLIDNKPQVKEADPPNAPIVEVKGLDKSKKEDMVLKNRESIHDIADKNTVFACLVASRINPVSKSNTDKILEINDSILDKNSVSSKESLSNKDSNKILIDSSEPKTYKVNEDLGKLKENEQKIEEVEAKPEVQDSTLNQNKTKTNATMIHKESPEVIINVSSKLSPIEKTQTLETNEIPNKPKTDDKDLTGKTKIVVSEVPAATKLATISKQVKNIEKIEAEKIEETKQETALDTKKPTKATDLNTEVDKINLVTQEGNLIKMSVEKETEKPKATIPTKNINLVKNKIELKALSTPDKQNLPKEVINIELTPNIEKPNPVPKSAEFKPDSQTENLNLVAKSLEQIRSLETKSSSFSKIEIKAPPLTAEIKLPEKNVDAKTVLQTNKFIPVAKGVEAKAPPKAASLNPTGNKIEPTEALKTFKVISDAKPNEPKTYSKTEKANQLLKIAQAKSTSKPELIIPTTKAFELKTVPKTVLLNPIPKGVEPKTSKVAKGVPVTQQTSRSNAVIITSNKIYAPSKLDSVTKVEIKLPEVSTKSDQKPINNNHTAVPFGKWTDANRQEFLNKFKEIKVPATSSSKQIKNSNDLNRIDVLKKIDSQRSNTASAKIQDKSNAKDTVFSSKITQPIVETKIPVKIEGLKIKAKPVDTKISSKPEDASETVASTVTSNVGTSDVTVPDTEERREVNVNDLIGKAIVDMLNRPVPMPMTRSPLDEPRHVDNKDCPARSAHVPHTEANTDSLNQDIDQQKVKIDQQKLKNDQEKIKVDQHKPNTDQQKMKMEQQKLNVDQQKLKTEQRKLNSDQQKLNIEQKIDEDSSGSLDYIEMKMNELHGIPFVERPPHELPKVHKTYGKSNKDKKNKDAKKLLPASSTQTSTHESVIDLESDEEIIEHEPITGDIDLSKNVLSQIPLPTSGHTNEGKETLKKDSVITEKDFDKFARRNSITYENCLTVKFDGKPGNVVQTVKEKDALKPCPKTETSRIETMTKLAHKQTSSQSQASKIVNAKFGGVLEDPNSKNYQSKIHTAYQFLTTKHQMDPPITIIEDKPVKVVFMDSNPEFVPNQLNVQGKELSPAKKVESTKVSPQSVNSNVTDALEQQDDAKAKTKHQRKQVLTPVEAPDLELIQPRDLGLDVSPKKKRKTDDSKIEKSQKNLVHKKSYLLGRASINDKTVPQELINPVKETENHVETVVERTVSAIDSLVKAAELLDNQSIHSASPNPDSQSNTPVKRGRGRPRKYPLPEELPPYSKVVSPSPQKKPRLIDAKPVKPDPISDDESSEDEQMIRENWTMGKINENIVCPICNKLFRSENVVFKHVKHCTGVSPTRSDLEKRSPRRRRYSRESDNKSFDSQSDYMEFEEKPKESLKSTPKNRKAKEAVDKPDEVEVIVIEDTPAKKQDTEKESIINRDAKEKSKPVQEPANEIIAEAQATSSKATQEKPVKMPQEKPQKAVEEKTGREKTLKEIADEKFAKAKESEELPKEKTAKLKKLVKTSVQQTTNLVCEFCGKTFRQLSYLASHKLQHKKEQLKKLEAKLTTKLQAFSCEVCKKEFRKMHHLVQHKIIHNPEAPTRTTRKSSSEQSDAKVKEQTVLKQNDDTSAGFRCEPCDKSFRKLHHLVEHRETHDGINRQKINAPTVTPTIEKPPPPPQCDVCKKSFRKLHHLIEHKEQHLIVEQIETSSEKSDDKSVQSSLSTRDIIHECSLCYMVFPNEHSLNKHFVICQQKKKRQSKAKDKLENVDGVDLVEESTNTEDSMDVDDEPKIVAEQTSLVALDDGKVETEQENKTAVPEKIEKKRLSENLTATVKTSETITGMAVSKMPVEKEKEVIELKSEPELPTVADRPDEKKVIPAPEKTKTVDEPQVKVLPKKTPVKDKVAPAVTRRQKSFAPLPILLEGKPVECSDDDEVRYMLNPNFKADETSEGKVFMKVRSNKRNSLQIERPNSKDLMIRRTSLQHPPKIPRLKAKAVEPKVVPTVTKKVPKPLKLASASTDSDDSDVKYSFPATVTEQAPKPQNTPKGKKVLRKSLAEKRKSLGGIAKRKSLGQAITKLKVNSSPVRIIKRRTLGVEHRCDCGQLFNSAALLTRHTSLAHTPPRIRRRRSPPPEPSAKATRNSTAEPATKSNVKTEAPISKSTRKSSVKSDTPETRKSMKPEHSQDKMSSAKPKRTAQHRGVPVPEKMRKLMMKLAK